MILSEELTLAVCIRHYLEKYNKSSIVINTSTSRLTEDIANLSGVKLYRVPTGEIHVTEKMEEINAEIGGEGNGGIILLPLNKCRDALAGIALVLDLLAEKNIKLEDYITELPQYTLVKKKFPAENIDFEALEQKIRFEFKNQKVDNQDGIRVDFESSWILVRKSNTEPIIRVFAESKNENDANALIEKIRNLMPVSG